MIAYLLLIVIPLLVVVFWFLSDMGLLSRQGWRNERAMWKEDKDRQYLVDRKARFKLYIEGEKQLMDDWEEAFDPVTAILQKELKWEKERIYNAYDMGLIGPKPYKPVRAGTYADPRGYSMIPANMQMIPMPGAPPAPNPSMMNPYQPLSFDEYLRDAYSQRYA